MEVIPIGLMPRNWLGDMPDLEKDHGGLIDAMMSVGPPGYSIGCRHVFLVERGKDGEHRARSERDVA